MPTFAPSTCRAPASPAQLAHDLDHLRRAGCAHRMALGEQPARRIDRNPPADAGRAAVEQRGALAARAEPERLVVDQLGDRERVVHFGDVDILRAETRLLEDFARAAHRDLGRGHVAEAGHEAPRRQMRRAHFDRIAAELLRHGVRRENDRGRAVARRAALQQRERIGDHARGEHLLHGHFLAHLRVGIERAVLAVLDRDARHVLQAHAVIVHVALRSHGIERRHRQPQPHFPIVLVERQRAAAELGQLLDPDHEHDVVGARCDRHHALRHGRRARRARVLDIDDGQSREPEPAHDALPHHRAAARGAGIDRLDAPRVDAGVLDRRLHRRPAEIGDVRVGIFPERDHADPDDRYALHRVDLPEHEASDRSFFVVADGAHAHFHLVADGEIGAFEMGEHARAVRQIDIADAHRLPPFLRRHMHHAESIERTRARHRLRGGCSRSCRTSRPAHAEKSRGRNRRSARRSASRARSASTSSASPHRKGLGECRRRISRFSHDAAVARVPMLCTTELTCA